MNHINVIVECPWDHSIGVDKQFEFCYTDNTRIAELLQAITGAQSVDETHLLQYQLKHKDQCFQFCPEVLLKTLLQYLQQPDTLYIEYQMGIPGGFGLDNNGGIQYLIHLNEENHPPHVHAKCDSGEISICLLDLKYKIRGNVKKQNIKKARNYTKQHQAEWLQEYRNRTNGLQRLDFKFSNNEE